MTAGWLSLLLFSGYLKELWRGSRADLNTARARLIVEAPHVHVEYDHEVLSGDQRLVRFERPPAWLDLDLAGGSGPRWRWRHGLYRAWAGVEGDRGALRVGRQRVAWGTGKLLNPTDVLNPYDPVSVERDERPGVDAAYARLALGDLSQAEAAYAPHDDWDRSFLLGRVRSNWRAYDVSLMGGKTAFSTGTWIAGGDFAGNLWDGTLHGELAYAEPRPRWLLGYERSFARDVTVLVEYFNNGRAVRPLTGTHYAGGSVGWEPHSLVKLELYGMSNLRDGSQLLAPSATWNALQDLHLTLGWQRFGGGKRSELGRLPNVLYAQAQLYF